MNLDVTFAAAGGRTVLARRRYRWPLLIGRVFTDPARPGLGSVTIQNAAGTVIPGDVLRQRISVADGGWAALRGQGATSVSGTPDGAVAVEDTEVRVASGSRLLLDPSPRILTADARYRQHIRVCVEPGGWAVLTDAVVLHPDLTDELFGGYESRVTVTAPDGTLLALDAQALDVMPRVRRAPTAFASVYLFGGGCAEAMTAHAAALHRVGAYAAVSDLPNESGWVIRIAAPDGGVLRAAMAAVVDCLCRASVPATPRADTCTPKISLK